MPVAEHFEDREAAAKMLGRESGIALLECDQSIQSFRFTGDRYVSTGLRFLGNSL